MNAQDLPSPEPWRGLPRGLGEILRPHLPALSEEVIDAIREQVPAYRRPLRGRFGSGIRLGVEEALAQFVDLLANPELDRAPVERVYRGLGRGEYRERRALDALLSAYRLGARVSWRRISALAIEAEVDGPTLALLAESVFAYIDEISALSAQGYAQEQSLEAAEAQRLRRRLARLLLDPRPDAAEVERAASAAGWKVPGEIAALSWSGDGRRLRSRLPAEALVVEEEAELAAGTILLPDPDAPGRADQLERAAAGITLVRGQTVAIERLRASAERARRLLSLIDRGAITAAGLVRAEDHLGDLVAFADTDAARELAARRLAPLDEETPASRVRLRATLRSWLDHQGEVTAVAADLQIHPQTVRYRLARLRECFGTALDAPRSRHELALALRAAASLPASTPPTGG